MKKSKLKENQLKYTTSIGSFYINEFYCGDALILLTQIPSKSIDLIITDPPFGIDFKENLGFYNRKSSNVLTGYKEVKKENYYDFSYRWIKECYRILKDDGSIYIVSGWTNLRDILNAVYDINFHLINHIIWKYQFGVYTKKSLLQVIIIFCFVLKIQKIINLTKLINTLKMYG